MFLYRFCHIYAYLVEVRNELLCIFGLRASTVWVLVMLGVDDGIVELTYGT
jgi:hypothetical protein